MAGYISGGFSWISSAIFGSSENTGAGSGSTGVSSGSGAASAVDAPSINFEDGADVVEGSGASLQRCGEYSNLPYDVFELGCPIKLAASKGFMASCPDHLALELLTDECPTEKQIIALSQRIAIIEQNIKELKDKNPNYKWDWSPHMAIHISKGEKLVEQMKEKVELYTRLNKSRSSSSSSSSSGATSTPASTESKSPAPAAPPAAKE